MPAIALTPAQVGSIIRRQAAMDKTAIVRGLRATSKRIIARLRKEWPVYQGTSKNAWQGDERGVWNDQPYAGIIERGARPHGVSPEGRELIKKWVIKKGIVGKLRGLKLTSELSDKQVERRTRNFLKRSEAFEKQVDSVVFAICKKIREEGQQGLFIVENNLDLFTRFLQEEVERALSASFASRGSV